MHARHKTAHAWGTWRAAVSKGREARRAHAIGKLDLSHTMQYYGAFVSHASSLVPWLGV